MMRIILVCFLVWGNILFAQKDDSKIVWDSAKKVLWSDFQGKVNPEVFGNALTAYKIDFFPENVFVDEQDRIRNYQNLTVKARFYKKESWKTPNVNNLVLIHEQLHFDIAELYARKIRKRFQELKINKETRFTVYSKEYKILWRECRKYQSDYDYETHHGIKDEINKTWKEKVYKELASLEKYEL